MKLIAAFRSTTTLICLTAGALSQAFGQSLSSACASALHEGAYSANVVLREAAISSFKAAGCLDEITKAYGVAGVPRRGDVSPLALAAIAYKSLLSLKNEGLVLSPRTDGGGTWYGIPPGGSGSRPPSVPWTGPGGPGGGVNTMPIPRMNSGGSIDAIPARP